MLKLLSPRLTAGWALAHSELDNVSVPLIALQEFLDDHDMRLAA